MDDELERYWLAGLLEGEGTFIKGSPSNPRCAVLRLAMTDEDVVQHGARLFSRAVIRWHDKDEPWRKPVFITSLKGSAALSFMADLRPVMGFSRQAEIDIALAAPRPRHRRTYRAAGSCLVVACPRPVSIRGLCLRHYKAWWKAKRCGRNPKQVPSEVVLPSGLRGGPLEPTPPSDPRSIAWLAGLLEGEGTFSNESGYPRISVQMCDFDVLERARVILGIGRVSPKDVKRNEERGWSPAFCIVITGSRAVGHMRTLRPLMGMRRQREIDEALAAYHPIRLTTAPAHCVIARCGRPHRSRGLCHKHYMSWSRDVARGRSPRVTPLR